MKIRLTPIANAMSGRAGRLIYYQAPGGEGVAYARSAPATVAQPRTIAQVNSRVSFRAASALWGVFTKAQKAYWTGHAASGQNGWVAFLAHTSNQINAGRLPQARKYTRHKGAPPAPTELTVEGREGCLVFTWRDAPGAFTTGLFMGSTPDFIPTLKTLVHCVPTKPGTLRQATVSVAPGIYYAVARSGAEDGGVGAAGEVVGAVEVT